MKEKRTNNINFQKANAVRAELSWIYMVEN